MVGAVVVVDMDVSSWGVRYVRSAGSTRMRAGSTPSASTMRRRSTHRNSSRGATGSLLRSCSSGSGIGGHLFVAVRATERESGADEQGLGRMDGAVEQRGNLGHGQAVEVPERERGAVH